MSKKRISIFIRSTRMFIAIAVLAFTVMGYSFYHDQMFADQFVNLVNHTAEKALDIIDNQIDFAEIVSDIQEIIADDDTTLMSVTGINQRNLQTADDEWDKIYEYADEVRGK